MNSEETIHKLKDILKEKFGENIVNFEINYDMPVFVVKKQILIELFQFLYNSAEFQFQFLTTLCGIHYPENTEPFGVIYHLHSLQNNTRIRIKSFTNGENPEFPTITGIFKAANWLERETYDFFGIKFTGHPNLKRILNVDEMTDFPLRKGFPLEDQTREDKEDKFFGR